MMKSQQGARCACAIKSNLSSVAHFYSQSGERIGQYRHIICSISLSNHNFCVFTCLHVKPRSDKKKKTPLSSPSAKMSGFFPNTGRRFLWWHVANFSFIQNCSSKKVTVCCQHSSKWNDKPNRMSYEISAVQCSAVFLFKSLRLSFHQKDFFHVLEDLSVRLLCMRVCLVLKQYKFWQLKVRCLLCEQSVKQGR